MRYEPWLFFREKNSALSSLVDSHRIVPTHAVIGALVMLCIYSSLFSRHRQKRYRSSSRADHSSFDKSTPVALSQMGAVRAPCMCASCGSGGGQSTGFPRLRCRMARFRSSHRMLYEYVIWRWLALWRRDRSHQGKEQGRMSSWPPTPKPIIVRTLRLSARCYCCTIPVFRNA